jgi:hypothetical protein
LMPWKLFQQKHDNKIMKYKLKFSVIDWPNNRIEA